MLNFFISSFILLLYAYLKFIRTKIFYPSVVFSAMWGMGCLVTGLILGGYFKNLYLSDYYSFHYLDDYMPYFAFTSVCAFSLAHTIFPGTKVKINFSLDFLERIIVKYHWIMWVNFFGGLLRIILMVNMVGLDSIMDYRYAANSMMMYGGFGPVGLVFRITAYVQMLANFYVALCGFRTGFDTLNLKRIVSLFILYSPTQLATGGRLFILYFILFFIGSFLLGRGLQLKNRKRSFLKFSEKKTLVFVLAGMFSLVSLIALARQSEGDSKESALAKFTYISEGMLETEHYMRFYPPENMTPDYGKFLVTGRSSTYLKYRGYLNTTNMSSIIISSITPLYTGFGYWGSIFVWGIIAFSLESLAIVCLRRLTVIKFFILLTILKIMYETIISMPIPENLPVYELIILFMIFYRLIFGKENSKSLRFTAN